MKVTAIVPVKGNSSRFPSKNIMPFADSNLLINKIRQLKNSSVDEILVTSDSEEMLEMALKEQVRAEKRPKDLADETRPFGDLVLYVCELVTSDNIMWAPVTSPTLDGGFYSEAIEIYKKSVTEGYDSFTTVEDFKHFLIRKDGKPYNFNPTAAITNSQQLPEMYKWTCGCSIISVELAKRYRYIFGEKPYLFEVNQYQSIDIDTKFDYIIAKSIFAEKNNI